MNTKTFELRDRGTFISLLATQLEPGNENDRYLISRSGYGKTADVQRKYVLMSKLDGGDYISSYHETWGNLSMRDAHRYIIENFDSLESGQVIDLEFIRGETTRPKLSESQG